MRRSRSSEEAGAAGHLAFDHLDLVDVALHGAGAVGQGEAGGDGLLVATDAVGEGAELGLVVGLDPGEPVLEGEQALALGHHLGEAADMPGQGVEVGAAGLDGGEPGLVIRVEAVRAGEQPAGDLAGLRGPAGCRGLPGVPACLPWSARRRCGTGGRSARRPAGCRPSPGWRPFRCAVRRRW